MVEAVLLECGEIAGTFSFFKLFDEGEEHSELSLPVLNGITDIVRQIEVGKDFFHGNRKKYVEEREDSGHKCPILVIGVLPSGRMPLHKQFHQPPPHRGHFQEGGTAAITFAAGKHRPLGPADQLAPAKNQNCMPQRPDFHAQPNRNRVYQLEEIVNQVGTLSEGLLYFMDLRIIHELLEQPEKSGSGRIDPFLPDEVRTGKEEPLKKGKSEFLALLELFNGFHLLSQQYCGKPPEFRNHFRQLIKGYLLNIHLDDVNHRIKRVQVRIVQMIVQRQTEPFRFQIPQPVDDIPVHRH